MKNMVTTVGIVLVVLGTLGLVFESVSWNEEKTIVDIGEFEASATVEESQTIPPLYAGGTLAVGLVIAAFGVARKA